MSVHVVDFVDEFVDALVEELDRGEEKHGDLWLERTREGQEYRIFQRYKDYYNAFNRDGEPIPWLAIVGNAMIAWVRENHPELWDDNLS